jgi:hypothetical protein
METEEYRRGVAEGLLKSYPAGQKVNPIAWLAGHFQRRFQMAGRCIAFASDTQGISLENERAVRAETRRHRFTSNLFGLFG